MNTKQQQAALAKISTKATKTSATQVTESTPIHLTVANLLGSVPSKALVLTESARANTKGFFSAMSTSYKYNEAKRKGLI